MRTRNNRRISLIVAAAMIMSACGAPAEQKKESGSTTSAAADQKDITSAAESSSSDATTYETNETKPEESGQSGSTPDKEKNNSAVVFSSPSGIYPESFELTLSCEVDGEIYYTTDGSDPTASASAVRYSGPLTISDRKGDKNVVSAVSPDLFSANFCEVNKERNDIVSKVSAPEDSAVDKCTVIRAAVKTSEDSFGGSTNAVYFIGSAEEHISGLSESCRAAGTSLAVISLAVNYDDLFDSKNGIYVKGDRFAADLEKYLTENRRIRDPEDMRRLDANYKGKGKDWERPAAVTFLEFSEDGSARPVLTQNCGIRIQGNYSRSDLQKGFRLFARSSYGKKNFKYAIFGEDYTDDSGKTIDKFDSVVLRAGGNCAFTAKFNDTFWQSLVRNTACETKMSRPCVVYLNGEYWGLYVLEEDYSNDYFEDVHGVNKKDVVVYKGDAEVYKCGYKLDEGKVPSGESEDYYFRPLMQFFASHSDVRSDADYSELCELVDPQSVMDYFAVECWINNKWDWPGKNWSMWKTSSIDGSNPYADGRWRFMFYDMEFGGVSGESDAPTLTIKEDNYKPKGLLDMDTNNPAVLCFAYMMTNEGFRKAFEERLTGLSGTNFSKDAALGQLRHFEDIYSPLYEQFFARYPGTGSADEALNGGYASSKCIGDFLQKREKSIQRMIRYCEKTLGS